MKSLKYITKITYLLIGFSVISGPLQASDYDEGLVAWSQSDYRTAVKLFIKSAAAGEAGAEHMLSRIYAESPVTGSEKTQNDLISAFEWALSAAEKGMLQAQVDVAGYYRQGRGTAVNRQAAAYWYRKAVAEGHHIASLRLAEMIERGDVEPAEAEEANRLFVYAASELDVFAQKGDAGSQTVLAGMYERGQGVGRSTLMAVAWYQKAAVQSYAAAEYHLGRLYTGAGDITANLPEAAYWLGRAARHGQPEAQSLLAAINGVDAPDVALGDR